MNKDAWDSEDGATGCDMEAELRARAEEIKACNNKYMMVHSCIKHIERILDIKIRYRTGLKQENILTDVSKWSDEDLEYEICSLLADYWEWMPKGLTPKLTPFVLEWKLRHPEPEQYDENGNYKGN